MSKKISVKQPVRYSDEVAQYICEQLANGRSLRDICRENGMPTESTVRFWVLDDIGGFFAQYTRARAVGYSRMAEEIVELSDTLHFATLRSKRDGKEEEKEVELTEHRRLQVETRKWLLSKMLPKVYGNKNKDDDGDDGAIKIVGGLPE